MKFQYGDKVAIVTETGFWKRVEATVVNFENSFTPHPDASRQLIRYQVVLPDGNRKYFSELEMEAA